MTKRFRFIFILFLFIGHFGFSQIEDTFIARSLTYQGTTLPYRLFIPANYSETKKYPLVLTLHGVGESGTDNYSQLLHTRLATSWADPANQTNYPCFVLSPQTNSGWDNAPVMETINKILDTLIDEFTIDANRLYATGLSMGGIGTWAIITQFPNRFAAAIPMSGGGDPGTVNSGSVTPIWNFHGTLDDIIPVSRSREMITALESTGRTVVYTDCQEANCEGLSDSEIEMYIDSHADLFYTEYEFGNHNIWDMSYDDPLLRPWVFNQYRPTPGAITITNLDTNRTLSGIETVSWQSIGGDSVEIWYSASSGETWQLVSRSEPNTGSYQWDTRNFGDGSLQLLNIFLKNSEGFIYSRDQSGYFTIDNQVSGTLDQTITFSSLAPVTYGASPITLSATASSGLTVYYTSSNTSVATVSGNTLTVFGAGTATITASQSGNASYNAAADVPHTFTVNKANQSTTFNSLSPVSFGSQPFTLTGQSSSGLSLSYLSSNISVASISGSTVTIVGAGTATITASQNGNANYNAAANVSHTLTVNKASQSITFNSLAPVVFGSQPFVLTGQSSSGLSLGYSSSNTTVATVSGNTVTIVGAGTATITASQSGNANYNAAANVPHTLTVNKANQSITFGTLAPVVDGASPFTLSATVSSGLTIYYTSSKVSVATISGNTVTIVKAGTAIITASQSGNANYNAATDVQQILTVNKTNQTITFGALAPVPYGALPFTLTATASSGLPIYYTSSKVSVATVSGNMVTIVGVGTTTITASQSGNDKHNVAADVQQTLTVNKANQSITFNSLAPVVFGSQSFSLTGQSSSGLGLSYSSSNTSVATVSGNTVTIVGAGTAAITASQNGNANYNAAADVAQTLIVNKAAQTISFTTILNVPESAGIITLVATSTSGLAINFSSNDASVATISGNTATLKGAGEVTFTASQTGNANYKAAPSLTQSICILPNKPTATANFANPDAPALSSSSATGNQWLLNANSIDGAINTIYIATSPGIYTVEVTRKGCTSPVSNELTIIITALEEPLAKGLYPNPAANEIVYSKSGNTIISMEIVNNLGQSLTQIKDVRAREIKIDISDLSAGSYILKVMHGDHLQAIRFIKK